MVVKPRRSRLLLLRTRPPTLRLAVSESDESPSLQARVIQPRPGSRASLLDRLLKPARSLCLVGSGGPDAGDP